MILGQLNNPWGKKGRLESLHPHAGSAQHMYQTSEATALCTEGLGWLTEQKERPRMGAAVVTWNLLFVPVAEMILPSETGREGDHTSGCT